MAGETDDAEEARLAQALERDVPAVLRALSGSAVEEIRLERRGTRIALRRALQVPATPAEPAAAAPADGAAGAAPGRTVVLAHMVGAFHRSRETGGPALVDEGEHVEAGRVLGVIETLGLANDVEAPVAGRVVELLEDGRLVEYGQMVAVVESD